MIAMVLAAGLGTRLRPLTERIAKPALPVLGTTLLSCNLALIKRAGLEEVVINAHHLPETVAAAARAAAASLGLRLHLSFEDPAPLGTGGALVAARPLLDRGEPILLVNGDVLSDLDLGQVIESHLSGGAAATMVLRQRPEGAPFAPVEVDERGWVIRIAGLGRPAEEGGAAASYTFTGIHLLSPEILDLLPAAGESCINRQGHVRAIERGLGVRAFVERGGSWSDVGTPERYLDANLCALDGSLQLPGWEWEGGISVEPDALVEEGAELIAPAYVGSGVTVRRGAVVGPRAALLAGATVSGQVRDSVVAPEAVVAAGAKVEGELIV